MSGSLETRPGHQVEDLALASCALEAAGGALWRIEAEERQ